MGTVGITGGSGFMGSHNTKKFLEEGVKVKVSATDISQTEKHNHLRKKTMAISNCCSGCC
ncbi:NAD-dependent epimerase/dehydratase family protein [Saccharicrinis sp. GN24d3]|uniref:NAD-dependent epimerase/dehydratase family protein n=1 Tax=Saccharicrinis sp. GN24d3 TaxID=3458416 RepID=UPI004035897B